MDINKYFQRLKVVNYFRRLKNFQFGKLKNIPILKIHKTFNLGNSENFQFE